jgi:hypothetical protein
VGPGGTLLVILLAAAAGAQLLDWLGVRLPHAAERFSFGAALGLGVLAYGVLFLGLAGQLTRPALLGLVIVVGLLGAVQLLRLARAAAREAQAWMLRRWTWEDWVALGLVAFCLTMAFLTLLAAMSPPSDLDWDGLTYHLAAPRLFLRHHAIHPIEYDSHSNFPFTVEMLFLLGLAGGGAAGAKLFHWAAAWLTALAIAVWVSRHLHSSDRPGQAPPPWAGPLAAALWMSIPLCAWEAGTAYIDLGTALFQFNALATLTRALGHEARRRHGIELRWTLVAGVLTGFALGTKATALLQFGLLGLALVVVALRSGKRTAWWGVLAFGGAALLVGSPWYIKSYIWTNNPVYPFLYSLFPGSIHWNKAFDEAYRHEQQSFGRPGHTLLDIFRAPWDLAFHGRDFFITTQRRLLWDRWASLSPLAVALPPLALYARRPGRRALLFLLYALLSMVAWWFLSQQSRYLLPVYAPLAAAGVGIVLSLPDRMLRRAALGFCGVSMAVGLGFAAQMALPGWERLVNGMSDEEYLSQTLPSLYPAVQFVDSLPRQSRIAMYQDTRGYYFTRDYLWANPGQHDLIPYDQLHNGGELVEYLRRHFGITHVLVNLSLSKPEDVEAAPWWQLLESAAAMGRLQPVFQSRSDALDRRRGIVIMEIR